MGSACGGILLALPSWEQVKKLQESQERTQAALKRKMEEHSIAMRKVRTIFGSCLFVFFAAVQYAHDCTSAVSHHIYIYIPGT